MYTGYSESTAVAGIAYYAADNYPPAWRDSAYVGDVISHRVNQFAIEWHGSSPKAILKRFLESDDPWFRPVHVQLGPDGALYVADFYNRIIGHYEVPLTHLGRDRTSGRIWRIIYRGDKAEAPAAGHGTPAPRTDWTTAAIGDLIKDMAHPNLTVRMHAMNQLVERGGDDGRGLVRILLASEKANVWQWIHGLWVLERGGALDDGFLSKGVNHRDRGVRVHAQRIFSERATLTPSQRSLAVAALWDEDAHVRRAAADALGRHPSADNVRPLLNLRQRVPADDSHLLHVVRMALRDQLQSADAWPQLVGEAWNEKDPHVIADVALGVSSAEAAAFLMAHLQRHDEEDEMRTRAVHHIARYGSQAMTERLLDFVRQRGAKNLSEAAVLFQAIQGGTQERGGQLAEPVRAWAIDLTGHLFASKHGPDVEAGIKLAGDLRLTDQEKRLTELALRRDVPEGHRAAALDALARIDTPRNVPVLGGILADIEAPMGLREQSAKLLGQANQPQTQAELLRLLPTAPALLQTTIARCLASSPTGAEKLLDAVKAGKASARLLQDPAVKLLLGVKRLPRLIERIEELTAGLPPAGKEIQELLQRRRESFQGAKKDAALGAQIFTKNCANCHQVGGQGAKIGPQLDGVGVRGLDRLLEDVLDPNRNVDQAFRQTTLTLTKGQVISGLLLKVEGEVYVLADSQGKEMRVRKDEVEERATSQVSPMPGNFAEQIPEGDLSHLLAYLLTLQSKPPSR
jgi:putative heme-binding domain-containing protein